MDGNGIIQIDPEYRLQEPHTILLRRSALLSLSTRSLARLRVVTLLTLPPPGADITPSFAYVFLVTQSSHLGRSSSTRPRAILYYSMLVVRPLSIADV